MSNLLEQASLVMIPSGYKEDVVYSEIPLDGSGDLQFTRSSNGTRVNSAGLVEVTPWNLLEQSESFSTSPWANTNVILTSGQIDPNGGTTAFRAQFSGVSYLLQNLTALNGTNSVYAKAYGSTAKIRLCDPNGSFSTQYNLTTEWQRITTSGNALAGFSIDSYIDGGWTSQDIVMAFAQVNIGSTAKPYFPTTDRLNVPRLTYQNGGGGCPSLLLEKQSTNMVTYSEQFDNANWVKTSSGTGIAPVVTANYAISPDGTQNADLVVFDRGSGNSTSDFSWIYQNFLTSSTTYTITCYIKAATSADVGKSLSWRNFGGGSSAGVTITNEWQRLEVQAVGSGISQEVGFYNRGGYSTGNSVSVLMWGFQAEASSYATSYIPTTSSSATRVADACYKTGISSLIGQTEGVMFVDLAITGTTGNNRFSISDGSNANWIFIGTPEDGATRSSRFYIKTNGTVHVDTGTSSYFTLGQRYKIALAYKSGDWAIYVNGSLLYSGTTTISAVSSPLSVFNFFNASGGSADCGEQINQAILFPTRLTNAELASLTTI